MKFPTETEFRADYEAAQKRATEIFDMVADADDWRGPIDAWVSQENLCAVLQAVEFFTATQAKVTEVDHGILGEIKVRVEAIGYRAGPAA